MSCECYREKAGLRAGLDSNQHPICAFAHMPLAHRGTPRATCQPPPERPKRFRVMNATACCTGRPNLHLSPVCVKLSEGHGRISKIKRVLDEIKRVWLLQGVRVARNHKGPFPALLSSLAQCEGAAPCGTGPLHPASPDQAARDFITFRAVMILGAVSLGTNRNDESLKVRSIHLFNVASPSWA